MTVCYECQDVTFVRDEKDDSVYPCPACKPYQYERWENGCYMVDHRSCSVCTVEKPKRQRKAKAS